MSEAARITAEARSKVGKGTARALRREGRIPAVIYGLKKDPEAVSVAFRDIQKMIEQGHVNNQLYEISVGATSQSVLARDVHLDPVTDRPIHVDFQRIDSKARVKVDVPVHFLNQDISPGLKRGGVLNVVRHDLELYCPATEIPHQIDIDLAEAEIGDSIHISAVKLPEGVEPAITDRDFTIATVAAPTVMPDRDIEEEEAAATEPELVARKKSDEDED